MRLPATGLLSAFLAQALLLLAPSPAPAESSSGRIEIDATHLEPGQSIDLSGTWHYKPGYALTPDEKPASPAGAPAGYSAVPVPQILNRIQWWLDDSEDFKKDEAERLAKLGFDTDKAEDGWYRLQIELPEIPAGRRLYLEFDGVAMRSETFMNGKRLGAHDGMFSRFEYDITPYAKPGSNLLAVFVSMEKIRESTLSMGQAVSVNLTASKVKTMSKGMFGPLTPAQNNRDYDLHGIWQPVRLTVRGEARLHDVWFLPSLTGAELRVTAGAAAGAGSRARILAEWKDKASGEVLAVLPPKDVDLSASASTHLLKLENVKPKLWSPASPNLYELTVTLSSADGAVIDRWQDNVGFRTFEARGNKLYLNGKPYWLRGANHLPYGKNPTDPALARKLVQFMHDNNERVTRTHCTPWNEAWLDAADEIGLGVSIEGPRPWAFAGKIGATPPELFAHWKMENEDIIRRCRNHPSVLIWTVGNEMLLRDHENLEKWAQLSEMVKETRRVDPTRPVVSTSSYEREPKIYSKVIQPNGFDDGDIDDIHSYKGWYADSPFITESHFEESPEQKAWARPFIGQEMSTGYPDLDTGLPTFRYTAVQATPQAWVGRHSYPGSDPAIFLEHQRAVTKRWAEQLRFQRGDRTAGFLLFANECWFRHSYDAEKVEPYPVVEAVKHAWAPVGLALESGRRRFYSEEDLKTGVYIINDDEEFRDLKPGILRAQVIDQASGEVLLAKELGPTPALPYYETTSIPVTLRMPAIAEGRKRAELILSIHGEAGEITRTVDVIELFARFPVPALTSAGSVIVVPSGVPLDELTTGGTLRAQVEAGATAILLKPGDRVARLFPKDIDKGTTETGEFADWSPAAGTPLARDLEPMDLKWWGRKNDWRVFVNSAAHRLREGGQARNLIAYVPQHGYTAPEKVPGMFRSVLIEIPLGKGRVWVCDLDLAECMDVDPAAALFVRNLIEAAKAPDSTKNLPPAKSHEELLGGRKL